MQEALGYASYFSMHLFLFFFFFNPTCLYNNAVGRVFYFFNNRTINTEYYMEIAPVRCLYTSCGVSGIGQVS